MKKPVTELFMSLLTENKLSLINRVYELQKGKYLNRFASDLFGTYIPNPEEIKKILIEEDYDLIFLRYGLIDGKSHTLEEIGNIHGVTRERIRQKLAKAMKKLEVHQVSKLLKNRVNYFLHWKVKGGELGWYRGNLPKDVSKDDVIKVMEWFLEEIK